MDINQIIKDQVRELNDLFRKASKLARKEHVPFAVEDYIYLKESQAYFGTFALPYFLAFSILKDIEYRISNPFPRSIWYWKKDVNKKISTDFLPNQSKLMYDTLSSYMFLLKTENYLQALILFRSYIEYSSQFYASLLDYEFFKKYTASNILEEEYKQLWFSSLKPAKVLSKIKSIHAEINQMLKEKRIDYHGTAIYRRMFSPFDSNLRGMLYNSLSGLAHGSYPALVENDETNLYALVFLCSAYLVESQAVIDEFSSIYFKYSPKELFNKWITIEIYIKSREPKASIYLGDNNLINP